MKKLLSLLMICSVMFLALFTNISFAVTLEESKTYNSYLEFEYLTPPGSASKIYFWSDHQLVLTLNDSNFFVLIAVDSNGVLKPLGRGQVTTSENSIEEINFQFCINNGIYVFGSGVTPSTHTNQGFIVNKSSNILYYPNYSGSGNINDSLLQEIPKTFLLNYKEPVITENETGKIVITYDARSLAKEYSIDDGPWITYTEPLTLYKDCTVFAQSKFPDNTNGAAVYNYTVNIQPPTFEPMIISTNLVELKVNYHAASQKKEYSLSTDNTWKTYTGSNIRVFNNCTVYARAFDSKGNMVTSNYNITNISGSNGGNGGVSVTSSLEPQPPQMPQNGDILGYFKYALEGVLYLFAYIGWGIQSLLSSVGSMLVIITTAFAFLPPQIMIIITLGFAIMVILKIFGR